MLRKIWLWLLRCLQRRCEHRRETVFEIHEDRIWFVWCRECGARRWVWRGLFGPCYGEWQYPNDNSVAEPNTIDEIVKRGFKQES